MRNKNSIHFTTMIILLSILTVIGEFALLYLMESYWNATLISCGIVLLVTLLLLFTSYHFEAVFVYMLLNVVLSSLLAGYRFWEIRYFYYSVTNFDLWMVLLNFLIPCLVSLLCSLFDFSDNLTGYKHLVRNSSILFVVYYIAIFFYLQFTAQTNTIWSGEGTNLIPFYTIAGYIEDYIYDSRTLGDVFSHLLLPILLYVPFGFLVGLLLRHCYKMIRLLTLFLLPIVIEVIQYFTSLNTVNIDDIIYGLLGGILGELVFFLLNALFLGVKGKEFAKEERNYTSGLHF